MLIAVVGFLSLSGGNEVSDDDARSAMIDAGCTFKSVTVKAPEDGQIHVLEGTKVTYQTSPPSAGPHYGSPAIWEFYGEAVDPRLLVHNQEHGGVVLWYGPDTPATVVNELRSFYESSTDAMVASQLDSLGSRVAITAWTGDPGQYGSEENYYGEGKAAVCPDFDEGAFETFRDTYRGEGPEGIPPENNQRGT